MRSPRSGSNVVAIVLLVLALIILVSGMAVWTGVKYLSHNFHVQVEEGGGGKKEVSINTPVGSIEVHQDVDEDSLGLPIYPGATRVKDKDSAAVNLGFGSERSLRVLAVKFETSDPLEKVKAFYKDRLGTEVSKFTDKGKEGKAVFEIKDAKQEKVVALEDSAGKTQIQLVRISSGSSESN
jgi:hypothetical protein